MANEQYAFLMRAEVPSRQQWQDAIDECGFDFKIDPTLEPFEHCGFLPCELMGTEAGVEVYYEVSSELREVFGEVARDKDCCISFRWGGSAVECASAMIASYALAKKFGAVVCYEGEDPYEDLGTFLRDTREIIEEAMRR